MSTPAGASMSPTATSPASSSAALSALGGERVIGNGPSMSQAAAIQHLGGAANVQSLANLLNAGAVGGQRSAGIIGQSQQVPANGNLSALLSALQGGAQPGSAGGAPGSAPGGFAAFSGLPGAGAGGRDLGANPGGWNALTSLSAFPGAGGPRGPGGVSAASMLGAAGMGQLGPAGLGPSGMGQSPMGPPQSEEDKIYALILDLTNPAMREGALLELSKKREAYEDLAPILWHSFGVISALLQEIISVYPILFPPTLTGHASNRVCNTLALLQCVASHPETRGLFLNGSFDLMDERTLTVPRWHSKFRLLTRLVFQHTSRSSSTPSSTPLPKPDPSNTFASPLSASSEP